MRTVTYTGRAGARILQINGLDVVFQPGTPVQMGDAEAEKLAALAPGEFRITPVELEVTPEPDLPSPARKPARATGKAK